MALHSYDRDMKPSSRKARHIMISRVQALVLAFFLMAWISLVAILVAAPEVYERRPRSLPGAQRIVDVVFVAVLSAFIAFLSIGVLRRWRWAFWLIDRIRDAVRAAARRYPMALPASSMRSRRRAPRRLAGTCAAATRARKSTDARDNVVDDMT